MFTEIEEFLIFIQNFRLFAKSSIVFDNFFGDKMAEPFLKTHLDDFHVYFEGYRKKLCFETMNSISFGVSANIE